MGKIFNNGLTKEDKKEGRLKRSKNIEDKNEELLKEIKNQRKKLGNKDSKTAKVKIILIYDQNHNFYKCRLSNISIINFLTYHQLNLNLIC